MLYLHQDAVNRRRAQDTPWICSGSRRSEMAHAYQPATYPSLGRPVLEALDLNANELLDAAVDRFA